MVECSLLLVLYDVVLEIWLDYWFFVEVVDVFGEVFMIWLVVFDFYYCNLLEVDEKFCKLFLWWVIWGDELVFYGFYYYDDVLLLCILG